MFGSIAMVYWNLPICSIILTIIGKVYRMKIQYIWIQNIQLNPASTLLLFYLDWNLVKIKSIDIVIIEKRWSPFT